MATTATMHGPARPGAREASTVSCNHPWQLGVCYKRGKSNLGMAEQLTDPLQTGNNGHCAPPRQDQDYCRQAWCSRGVHGALISGLVSYGQGGSLRRFC